jgi:hypothetical protein
MYVHVHLLCCMYWTSLADSMPELCHSHLTMKIQNCRICNGALRQVGTCSKAHMKSDSETRLTGQSAAGLWVLSHCGRLMLAPGPAAP